MKKIKNALSWLAIKGKQLCCLRGIVAIIFTILFVNALMHGSLLIAVLMGIFTFWSFQAIYRTNCCSGGRRRGGRAVYFKKSNGFNRDLDI